MIENIPGEKLCWFGRVIGTTIAYHIQAQYWEVPGFRRGSGQGEIGNIQPIKT